MTPFPFPAVRESFIFYFPLYRNARDATPDRISKKTLKAVEKSNILLSGLMNKQFFVQSGKRNFFR